MRASTLTGICTALAAVWFIIYADGRDSGQPTYHDHRLSYWVERANYSPVFEITMHGEGGFKEREEAFQALQAMGAPAVGPLSKMVEDKTLKWDRRWRAAETLGRIGAPARPAVPSLIRALSDPTFPAQSRESIVQSLDMIGAAGACARELTNYLASRYAVEPPSHSTTFGLDQYRTVSTLGGAGEPGKIAVPLLVEMLGGYEKEARRLEASSPAPGANGRSAGQDALWPLRRALVEALAKLGAFEPQALPAIRQALDDPAPPVRLRVAQAFIELGQPAEALPLLDQLAAAPDRGTREALVAALGLLGGNQTAASVPRLVRMLGDPDEQVRWLTVDCLGRMGVAGRPALPDLKALVHDQSARVREAARQATVMIEGESKR
jgi:HEAT repeat protein